MALFVAKIFGSNASLAYAYNGGKTFTAFGEIGGSVVQVDGVPALFESREEAREIALACHWNNQRFGVYPARGRVREEGQIVKVSGDVTGCQ